MNKSSRARVLMIIGLFLFAFTSGFYLLFGSNRTESSYWAFGLLLVSEAIFAFGLTVTLSLRTRLNERWLRVCFISIFSLYLIAMLVLTVLLDSMVSHLHYLFLGAAVIHVVLLLLLTLLFYIERHILLQQKRKAQSISVVVEAEQRLAALVGVHQNLPIIGPLTALYEQVRFADKNGYTSFDNRISTTLGELERDCGSERIDNKTIQEKIEVLERLIRKRNQAVFESKRN